MPKPPLARLPAWKRALYGGVLAALFLGFAEGVARLTLGAPESQMIAPIPARNTEYFATSGDTVRTLYQGDFSIGDFPARPDPKRPRVIWLGGSSIRGGDGQMALDLEAPALVTAALDIEGLNLGAPGIDSHHLLQMIPTIIDLQPTAVVIYTGHNDRGNAVFFNHYGDLRGTLIARTRGLLGGLRLFQLIEETIQRASPPRPPEPGPEGSFRLSEAHSLEIELQFEAQLRRSVRMLVEADITVVLSTVISNAWGPPHSFGCAGLLETLGLRPHPSAPVALHHLDRDTFEAHRSTFEDCHEQDWLDGLLLRREGNVEASAQALNSARDGDFLPLRANSRTQEAIRRVAREEGATLVDTQAVISATGSGIEPMEFFSDEVHPNPTGHRALASVIAPVLATILELPDPMFDSPAQLLETVPHGPAE